MGGGTQAEQLPQLKRLLDNLPETNLLWHHERFRNGYGDNDPELVDLFLHPVDQAFTVPQLDALCADVGLRIVRFLPTARYEPATYLSDEEMLVDISRRDWLDRAALAELMAGNIHMHFFFVVRAENTDETRIDINAPDLADLIPVLRDSSGPALAAKLGDASNFSYGFDGTNIVAEVSPLMRDIITKIDGERTLEDIYLAVLAEHSDLNWLSFRAAYGAIHQILHDLLYGLFLRR